MLGHGVGNECFQKREIDSCSWRAARAFRAWTISTPHICGSQVLTHGATENGHKVKQCIESIMVALDVTEGDFGEPFAFQAFWQWLKRGRCEPAGCAEARSVCEIWSARGGTHCPTLLFCSPGLELHAAPTAEYS